MPFGINTVRAKASIKKFNLDKHLCWIAGIRSDNQNSFSVFGFDLLFAPDTDDLLDKRLGVVRVDDDAADAGGKFKKNVLQKDDFLMANVTNGSVRIRHPCRKTPTGLFSRV
jgi:hypothetical protein